ncbi:MAG: hypothetical protein IJ876_02240 [Elusimicrobiaceae bacterium]|nr:hypothetical protein [Elusimicrobiaceae bacterium]
MDRYIIQKYTKYYKSTQIRHPRRAFHQVPHKQHGAVHNKKPS